MAKKFLTPIDLNGLELLNAVVQNLATAPAHAPGRMYFDTTVGKLGISTGAAWIYLSTAVDLPISLDSTTDSATRLAMTAAERTKLSGIATGATANSTDAQLRDRSTHTGTQLASTISDFDTQVRTSRLDQMATPTADVAMGTRKLTGLGTPTASTDAATKGYVDATAQGLDIKASVKVATTANITTTGLLTIDGVTLVASDRVLVKNQTTKSQNGIWVAASGAWTRATDADAAGELSGGAFVFVEDGTTQADTGWVITTNGSITPGTTAHDWAQFSGAGSWTAGAGLTQTGTTLDVGAGTGITGAADSVAIDTAVVVRKYAASIGDAVATSFVVTHNLNTRDVMVMVYLNSGTYEQVETDVEYTSVNTVTLRFAVAPAASAYRVVVQA
jgi:hypothetical protein